MKIRIKIPLLGGKQNLCNKIILNNNEVLVEMVKFKIKDAYCYKFKSHHLHIIKFKCFFINFIKNLKYKKYNIIIFINYLKSIVASTHLNNSIATVYDNNAKHFKTLKSLFFYHTLKIFFNLDFFNNSNHKDHLLL